MYVSVHPSGTRNVIYLLKNKNKSAMEQSVPPSSLPASKPSTSPSLPAVEFEWPSYIIYMGIVLVIYISTRVMSDQMTVEMASRRKNPVQNLNSSWTVAFLATLAYLVTNQKTLRTEVGTLQYLVLLLAGACVSGVVIFRVLSEKINARKPFNQFHEWPKDVLAVLIISVIVTFISLGLQVKQSGVRLNLESWRQAFERGSIKWFLFLFIALVWFGSVIVFTKEESLSRGENNVDYGLHIHHWQLGYMLLFLLFMPHWFTVLASGLALGMFVEGISTWDADSFIAA